MENSYTVHVTREQAANRPISFRLGNSQMFLGQEDRPNFDIGLERITGLSHKTESYGIITTLPNGKTVDNRKYKLNKPEVREDGIIIPLGVTHWQDYCNDVERAEGKKFEEIDSLVKAGHVNYRDTLAYFASPLGIEVLPITSDGYAVFLPRGPEKQQFFTDKFNTVATFVEYRPRKEPRDLSLEEDILRAFREKLGIFPDNFYDDKKLVGVASDNLTGGNAIMYMQRLKLKGAELREMKIHLVRDISEIKAFGEKLEPPTSYLADMLTQDDIKPL
jgi:hypothetical protein